MEKKWIQWATMAMGTLAAFFLIFAAIFYISRPSKIDFPEIEEADRKVPRRPFALSDQAYEAIDGPFLSLEFSPHVLKLPDLRRSISYLGKNGRPDAQQARPLMHISFGGAQAQQAQTIAQGKKMYLIYDKTAKPPRFALSPNNAETSLWLVAEPGEKEAQIEVRMKAEGADEIAEPREFASFTVPEREQLRFSRDGIDLGKWRVDGSVLVQQKARWFGQDIFLEQHGGEEYAAQVGKQRIDFEDEEEPYSVFIGPETVLAWINDRWVEMKSSEDSARYPILTLKKISDRLMSLELWGVDGKGKIPLNLIKSAQRHMLSNLEREFQFVGSRTWSQFIFEINGERILIKPKDWLLKTNSGWIKFETSKQIDEYLARKLIGTLLIFERVARKGGKQYLIATAYDPTRTETFLLEIPVQKGINPDSVRSLDEEDNDEDEDEDNELE